MVHHMSTLLSFPIWEHMLERYCFLVCHSCKHFNFTQLFLIRFFFLRKLIMYRDYFNKLSWRSQETRPLYQTCSVMHWDAREVWPLLTMETEANGDSWSTYERGPFLVVLLGLSCWYKRFLFCLGHFGQLSTKYLSSAHTISLYLSPLPASWVGSHAVVTCLLICVSVHALFYEAIVAGTTFI
jgi:hypothetical protein